MEFLINSARGVRFQGKYRLLNALVPRRGTRTAEIFGYKMELDLARWIQRNIYFGTYERDETRIVRELLRPGMTVVDAGANIGYYTALAASIVGPSGRVFAVEPNSMCIERLDALAAHNRISQIHICPFALGADDEPKLLNSENENDNATLAGGSGVPVEVRTLDSLFAEHSLARVDFLKIDVEGWEIEILDGSRTALAERRIGAILCEFNEIWSRRKGTSNRTLWGRFVAAGFAPAWPMQIPDADLFNALFILT